ncbi:signal peptidase I [Chamaesiphon minutus]|uniref:Signal peptidase I n=1 Tax=Chamaesiphon minutus (strain ATCC 27169 / PCC 6605) TaxID=1173020 RepID=K9UI00_CHAP6|nr:signal peptidase I [Chamaesiphon minutus]AFY94742.1 signal peptidase I [Chamaesiphon minutus PCC 6605]
MKTNPKQSQPESTSPQPLLVQWWQKWSENITILVVAIGLAFFIRTFIAEPRYIPSESMLPTLEVGDRVIVEKLSYYSHPPQRGDIIVFAPPPQLQAQGYLKDRAFIKRVIGLPGNTIEVKNGRVYVDRELLTESYIAEPPNYAMSPVVVPSDQIFVMGDNRNNSNDSHVWGFLPKTNIIGHACFRFWPLERWGGMR